MNRIKVIIGCLVFMYITNCDISDSTNSSTLNETNITSKEVIFVESSELDDWLYGLYRIEDAQIKDDEITLHVVYSACTEHSFEMVIGSYFGLSVPVHVYSLLSHDIDDDSCKKTKSTELKFDLKPLKEFYHQQFSSDHPQKINISIREPGENNLRVLYDFSESN